MSIPAIAGVTLGEELGRGAMGTVYAGTLDGAPVAVKVLERTTEPGLVRAFRTEARAMATLAHPNVIGVLDVGTEGTPYVVMERADQVLSKVCGRRHWEEVEGWIRQLLLGLAHAHARGIVHRDLKPGNVLLANGTAKLADFGLARAFETVGAGNLERPAGTPGYMPPEQRQGRWRDIGPWTDLYALGRVALDLVTRPDGTTFEVPAGFAAWVSRLRQERARDRFRRASDALFAFELLGAPQVALAAGLAGSGPAPQSELAMTQPYFEDQDQLAEALPEPVEVRTPSFPNDPVPLHPEPIARRASMVGLRVGRPVGEPNVADTLWGHAREATVRPTLIALRGEGRAEWAMWLCHQVHETGIGSVELVTHDPLLGPRSGLGGMLARELRALDLTPRRAVERLEELLEGQAYASWRSRVLTSVMAPALAVGTVDRVDVSRPERHAEVERFVRLDAERRLPLIWADDVHLGRDVREWIETLLSRGEPALIVATLPDGALPTWLSEHAAEVVDLTAPDDATCRSHLMERLGLTGGAAASLAARCGTDVRRARLLVDSNPDASDSDLFARVLTRVWPPHRDRRVLGCAATLGMHVEGARWRDVCRRARAPFDEDYLEELVASGIAIPVGLGGTGDWVFSDPMLRELVLDGVNPRPLHRATALSYPLEAETAIVRGHHLRLAGVPDAALRAISEALPVLATRRDDDRLAGSLAELSALAPTVPEAAVWAEAVRWALGGNEPPHLPEGAGSLALLAGERARERGDDDGWMRALDLAEGLAAQAAATDAAEVTWQRAAYLVRRGDPTSVKVALPVLEDALRSIGPSQKAPLTVELAYAHHLLGDRARRDEVLATICDPDDGGWLAQLVRDLLAGQGSALAAHPQVQRVPWLRPLVHMLDA